MMVVNFMMMIFRGDCMKDTLAIIDEYLQACLFLMMGMGLLLASGFLMIDKIDGGGWVTVCGILFGSNAIGGGISQFGKHTRHE